MGGQCPALALRQSRALAEPAQIVSGDRHGSRLRGQHLVHGEIRHRQRRRAQAPRRQWHRAQAVLARDPRCLLQGGAAVLRRDHGKERELQEDLRPLEEFPRRRAPMVPRRGVAIRQLHDVAAQLSGRHTALMRRLLVLDDVDQRVDRYVGMGAGKIVHLADDLRPPAWVSALTLTSPTVCRMSARDDLARGKR